MAFGSTPVDSNNIPLSCAYLPGTGFKAIRGASLSTDGSSNDSVVIVTSPQDGYKTSYSAVISALQPAASAQTDIITITGSASKTVRITRIEFGATIPTTAVQIELALLKRSTADTVGTQGTVPTIVPLDSTNAAATATLKTYTAAPTVGAAVGQIRLVKYLVNVAGVTVMTPTVVWDFGTRSVQCPVLRGIGEVLAISVAGWTPAVATALIDASIEFSEE